MWISDTEHRQIGRGLSTLQRGLLAHLELAQFAAARVWADEALREWERLPGRADSCRRDALDLMQKWGGPLTPLWASFGGLTDQPKRVADAQRKWDRAESYATDYAAGPELFRAELGYATYGSLLRHLHPTMPLLASAETELGRTYGTEWDHYRRQYQQTGHIHATCADRESHQAAMRRALIRLENRGLICRNRGRAWLPDLLPGAAEMSAPTMPDLTESLWERVDRENNSTELAKRLRAAALLRRQNGTTV